MNERYNNRWRRRWLKPALAVIIAVVAIGALYWKGETTSPVGENTTTPSQRAISVPDFDINQWIAKIKANVTRRDQQLISQIEDTIRRARTDGMKANGFIRIGRIWQQLHQPLIAAHYYREAALLNRTEADWLHAAQHFQQAFLFGENDPQRNYAIQAAIACYEEVLKINSRNSLAKINLALCYTEGTMETMKGVRLLLEVVEQEPENVQAQFQLGRLSMIAGEADKAIERFERVTSLQRDNREAWLFLAEAYVMAGKKQQAIAALETCKALSDDEAFRQKVDEYIRKLIHS